MLCRSPVAAVTICSTASSSRPTVSGAPSFMTGLPAPEAAARSGIPARNKRSASARRCGGCQVARFSATTPTMCSAQRSISPGVSGSLRTAAVPLSARSTMVDNALSLPRMRMASRRQAVRCSACERGSCLRSRVARVARCARSNASVDVGSRPWSAWNVVDSSPIISSMAVRRDDQEVINPVLIPTISRTGRLPRSAGSTSANETPSRSDRCASRRVL